MEKPLLELVLPDILPATNEEIVAYLRHSYQIAEIAAATERDALVVKLCEQLDITVTDGELQAAGDAFRQKNNLLSATETLNWLAQQRITAEEWSQSIHLTLLAKKLKEKLFGKTVDAHYIRNRDIYKRVALSQILVRHLSEGVKIAQALKEEKISFCALAIEHSKGKQSRENGGFAGIHFWSALLPEITQALVDAKEGEIIGPVQTKLGYHILRVEKWISTEFNHEIREQILELNLQSLLKSGNYSGYLFSSDYRYSTQQDFKFHQQ